MMLTFALQAVCLLLVVTVGRLSGGLFALTLVLVYFTWGEIYSLFPSTCGRLLRHAPCHVELRRALHRERRGVHHRRLVRGDAVRTVRQLGGRLLRQRPHGAHRRRSGRGAAYARRRRRTHVAPCRRSRSEQQSRCARWIPWMSVTRRRADRRLCRARGPTSSPPTARDAAFDLAAAYAVKRSWPVGAGRAARRPSGGKSASRTRRCGGH